MVPLEKYQDLERRYNKIVGEEQSPAKNTVVMGDKKIEQKRMPSSSELAGTVDVFATAGVPSIVGSSEANERPSDPMLEKKVQGRLKELATQSDQELEEEIEIYRKAKKLLEENKINASWNELKKIEKSNSRHVRVHTKFLMGEAMFAQQEYDLAMQIYEEIINQDAFSGVILKALGRLIVCSEKLKLEKKRKQYYSMLHNFFDSWAV